MSKLRPYCVAVAPNGARRGRAEDVGDEGGDAAEFRAGGIG